jgi:hypothetical protein
MSSWKDLYTQHYNSKIKTLYPAKEVENFINRFFARTQFADPITSRHIFLYGNCYWFAVILKERFKTYLPTIWYDSLNNHFYTCICGILYDANGAFIPEHNLTIDEYNSFYIWEDYKKFDRTHANRITKQCINFGEED